MAKHLQCCSRYWSTVLAVKCTSFNVPLCKLVTPAHRFGLPIFNGRQNGTSCSNLRSLTTSSRTFVKTDGDKDLDRFLGKEIQYEETNKKEVKRFKDFNVSINGTMVMLNRTFNNNNEKIELQFNCNNNKNYDDNEMFDEEDTYSPENADVELSSHPVFTISIIKTSGLTLLYECECNAGTKEDILLHVGQGDEDDECFELFHFKSVSIYTQGDDPSTAFELPVSKMEGEMMLLFMNILNERGIDGGFINHLIELSTSVEHRHYLAFLKHLQNFCKAK